MALKCFVRNRIPLTEMHNFARFFSRKDCFRPAPSCKKDNLCKKINMKDCFTEEKVVYKCLNPMSSPEEIKKVKKHPYPFRELLHPPECCAPCDDLMRLDEKYYKISDKAKRKYQQTWVSCPKPILKPRRICVPDETLPPIKRRQFCDRPPTACAKKDCLRQTACPRIKMPCCPPSRIPPKCKKVRRPSNCIKVCAPYPAYSECKRPLPKKRHPVECKCLASFFQCEAFRYLKKHGYRLP